MMVTNKKKYSYRNFIKCLIIILYFPFLNGCIEPFDFETESFESILVVNATITNEIKSQEIILSRTFRFEEDVPIPEVSAFIRVVEDSGNEYIFQEGEAGHYKSIEEFRAIEGREYQLFIQTSDGNLYVSNTSSLTGISPITDMYPVQMSNDSDEIGIGILVDSFDPEGNSIYYRYEYEETYRFDAPDWVRFDIVSTPEGLRPFELVDRPIEKRICYKTEVSNEILVVDTNSLSEDRIDNFVVRFIKSDDVRISDRYSILVRQFIQSEEANGFYKQLSDFSSSDNLFSQTQPGFIVSNITSENNPDEKVLGFFDVSSVSEMRIFFNREDIIQNLPIFTLTCERITPEQSQFESDGEFLARLTEIVNIGNQIYFEGGDLSLTFVDRECGDCTASGESEVPDFWID